MDKLLEIPAFDRFGEPNTRILTRMSAAVFQKTAGTLPPEVKDYLERLEPDPQFLYLLIVALGAADFWGSNVNGDAFFEKDLLGIQTPMEAGRNPSPYTGVPLPRYKTFLSAHIFKHHVNKDPANSFGKVDLPIYDKEMHRILLILAADRAKAPDIVNDIDKNGSVIWSMGCFTEDAIVQMADGRRIKISNIIPGNEVITHLGNIGNVLNTQRRWYDGEVYEIEVFGVENKIIATPEHPFWASELDRYCRCGCGEKLETSIAGKYSFAIPTKNRFKIGHHNKLRGDNHNCIRENYSQLPKIPTMPFKFTDAKELAPGDFLLTPASQGKAPSWVTPGIARLFGYFLAEGSYLKHKGKHSATVLSFAAGESYVQECVDLFKSEFDTNAKIYNSYGEKHGTCSEVRAYNHKVAPIFYKYCGEYSDQKRIHSSIMQWPRHLKMELIGAYLNGDASLAEQIQVYTCSKDLAEQMHALANSCGIANRLCTNWPSMRTGYRLGHKQKYALMIDPESANQLLEYSDVRPFVRANSVTRHIGNFNGSIYRQIKSITRQIYSGYVYNFEVKGDNSYIVNDVAVHNCKVPFDSCSVCHHRSKKVDEYCEHLKTAMNETWSNGHKVYAVNTMPRFFDISRVLIPADKIAMTLMKLASATTASKTLLGDDDTGCGAYTLNHCSIPSAVIAERVKVAQAKLAFERKEGEIKKEVPAIMSSQDLSDGADRAKIKQLKSLSDRARLISSTEKDLPRETLERLSDFPLHQILSSMAGLGMVAKPNEVTRIIIIKIRRGEPAQNIRPIVDEGAIKTAAIELLLPFLTERSALAPWITRRAAELGSRQTAKTASDKTMTNVMVYQQYRQSLMGWDESVSRSTIVKHAHLLPEGRTASSEEMFNAMLGMTKESGAIHRAALAGAGLFAPYLYSAHLQRSGKSKNVAQTFAEKHPGLLGSAGAIGAYAGARKFV